MDWNKNEVEDKHTITSVPASKFYGVSKDEDLKSTSFLVEIDGVFLRNQIYREIVEQVMEAMIIWKGPDFLAVLRNKNWRDSEQRLKNSTRRSQPSKTAKPRCKFLELRLSRKFNVH